jgi:hypothetical protein
MNLGPLATPESCSLQEPGWSFQKRNGPVERSSGKKGARHFLNCAPGRAPLSGLPYSRSTRFPQERHPSPGPIGQTKAPGRPFLSLA